MAPGQPRTLLRALGERSDWNGLTVFTGLGSGLVTTPRHHLQYVVTEFGVADLTLAADRERAEALIAIGHPDFRDELRRARASA